MPSLQKIVSMLYCKFMNFVEFTAIESVVHAQFHWIKPELGFIASRFHVNMRRFLSLVPVEGEPITANSQHCWHPPPLNLKTNWLRLTAIIRNFATLTTKPEAEGFDKRATSE